MAIIRSAHEDDLPSILTIYNQAILTSTATYDVIPQTFEMRRHWFAEKQSAGMPVLVVEDEIGVAGFGSFGQFRPWAGYRFSVEHSLYVADKRQGRGHGKLLLAALIGIATHQGVHTMLAGVDAANVVSLRLHRAFGFTECGNFREIGYKFDSWRDLLMLQKMLPQPTLPR